MDETLFTAARRVVRFFNIDMNSGGLVTTPTEQAMETLNKMVVAETARLKTQGIDAAKLEPPQKTLEAP